MKRIVAFILLSGLLGCESSLPKDQAHFAKGFDAYKKGDFYTALLYLKPLVEDGHPAAELLLAKMYANGEGVKEDIGKAELLRNLAATKIYSKPLPPGVVRSANGTLKSVQDRLDYYAGDIKAGKDVPVGDLSQVLTNLDLDSIKRMAATDLEGSPPPAQTATDQTTPEAEKTEPAGPPAEAPAAVASSPSPASSPLGNPEPVDMTHTKKSNQISLALLRQSAEENDPLALELLSSAYSKGYYGLTPDHKQAAAWRQKARLARRAGYASSDQDTEENIPVVQIVWVALAGLALMGSGVWLGVKRKRKRIS